MRKIFRRFSRTSTSYSAQLLNVSMDVETFDEQLSAYENLLYSGFPQNEVILTLQPQRYKWLLANDKIPLHVLLGSGEYLIKTLDGLSSIIESLEQEHQNRSALENLVNNIWDFDAKPYRSAAGKVKAFYCRLLEEAAIVTTVLSSRLRKWYEKPVALQYSGTDRFYYVRQDETEEEAIFFQVANITSKLHAQTRSLPVSQSSYKAAVSEEALSVQDRLSDTIANKQQAISDNLASLGLSTEKLLKLNKQHKSF